MADNDELFGVRNLLFMGSYQQVINDASNTATAPRSDVSKLERKVLLYRAYIGQRKYNLVISEIAPSTESSPPELRAVRNLAAYLQAVSSNNVDARERAVKSAREVLAETGALIPALVHLLVATVTFHEGLYDETLKILAGYKKNLECVALFVETLLKLDRVDLATSEVTALKTWSEDAPLAQIIEAWIALKTGGDSYQQAFYVYEELGQSSAASTVKMLNGKAIASACLAHFEEAESILLDALNKDPNHPETLVNLITISIQLSKPVDVINRYTNQLKDISPNHIFLQDLDLKDTLFDRTATRFALAT